MAEAKVISGPLRTLSWAVYLGISWTWCIGMFLPVILVSEFGLKAWFVFAIPNVVGAAAMGWTLARPGSSEQLVQQHRTACVAFSAVTLAFQMFFLIWLNSAGLMPTAFAMIALGSGLSIGLIGRRWMRVDLILAWLVLAVSLTVFAKGLVHPVVGVADPLEASRAWQSMMGLAPVCVFGFLLCPYLDVTFHRARQQTPAGAGKVAFGIGFGVVFLSMIVLTLLYAGDFARDDPSHQFGSYGWQLLRSWVALHIAIQIGFTLSAHLRALPAARRTDIWLWIGAAGMLGLAVFVIQQQKWAEITSFRIQRLSGEFVYRLFMSFYGLVFPAYIWICMVPIPGFAAGPTRRAWIVTAFALLVAAPMFWWGFIDERMLWLIPGVGVVLLAKLLSPSVSVKPGHPASNSGA